VPIGYLELIVRDTDDNGAVTGAGLAVAPEPTPGPALWPVVGPLVDFWHMVRGWLVKMKLVRPKERA